MVKTIRNINLFQYIQPITLGLMVTGWAIRLVGLGNSSIWYDESLSLFLIRLNPLELVRAASLDFNPPLWELITWPWVKLFGENEIALRLPAFLLGCLSLWLVHKLTQELKLTDTQGLSVMALCALLPYQIYISQDGRGYALIECLFLGGIYFALRSKPLGILSCSSLLLYAHSIGIIFSSTIILIAIIRNPEQNITSPILITLGKVLKYLYFGWLKPILINRYFLIGLASLVLFLPWVPSWLHANQLFDNGNNLTFLSFLYSMLLAWMGDTFLYNSLAGLFVVLFLFGCFSAIVFSVIEPFQDKTFRESNLPLIAFMAIFPLGLILGISLTIKDITFYRSLSPLVPVFCLWIGSTITPRRLTYTTWFIPLLWGLLLLVGLANWNTSSKGGGIKQVAQFINSQYQEGDIIYHATGTTLLPFAVYQKDRAGDTYLLDEDLNTGLLSNDLQKVFSLQKQALETIPHKRAWIIWANDPSITPQAQERIKHYLDGAISIGLVKSFQFSDIQIYLKESK